MTKYNIVVEKDSDGFYVSEVLELPGCHTQAKTYDQLLERTKEAIELYLMTHKKEKSVSKFVGLSQLEVKA